MSRIKEPKIGSDQLPDYKSPPSRINRSLRAGYDNLRGKVAKKSSQLDAARGKIRDITQSRDEWKKEAKDLQNQLKKLQSEQMATKNELDNLKKKRC